MTKGNSKLTIGVDIGGTKIRAVLWDGTKVLDSSELATPTDSLDHFLIMLKAAIDPLLEKALKSKTPVVGLGFGVPSVLDPTGQIMLNPNNLKMLKNIRLAERASQFLGLPVVMDNDAACFVRAEALAGAGKEWKNVYGITLGTGIGGAWWLDGKVYPGAHNGAGNPWRMVINNESGVWLEESFHRLLQRNPRKVSQEAIMGDVLAEKSFQEFGRIFGFALANIVNLIDPEVFVLGGSVMDSSDLFLNEAKKVMKENIDSAESAKRVKVAKSKWKQDAGAVGAALLVTQNV